MNFSFLEEIQVGQNYQRDFVLYFKLSGIGHQNQLSKLIGYSLVSIGNLSLEWHNNSTSELCCSSQIVAHILWVIMSYSKWLLIIYKSLFLSFALEWGSYANVADQLIYLCFDDSNSDERKTCRYAESPLSQFLTVEKSNHTHRMSRVAASTSKLTLVPL